MSNKQLLDKHGNICFGSLPDAKHMLFQEIPINIMPYNKHK